METRGRYGFLVRVLETAQTIRTKIATTKSTPVQIPAWKMSPRISQPPRVATEKIAPIHWNTDRALVTGGVDCRSRPA